MNQRWTLLLLTLAACGDNHDVPIVEEPDPEPVAATCDEANLPATLGALPHVTSVTERACGSYVSGDVRCFAIAFEQPIQHATPEGPQFTQQLFLMHRGCDRPTLVADWGYSNDVFFDDELSVLYDANAMWVEHRYQGASRPATSDWDWTALTIENGAADMHEIVTAFRTHYGAHFVSTGASKGGITATYHHYLHPDDLDGAVPYVAPASRSTIDGAYQTFLTSYLPPCAQTLRDAQVAALSTRRPAMLQRLTAVAPGYEELLLEYMTSSFDWAFWQYYGVEYCDDVPTATATDDELFDFFYQFSGFGFRAAPADDDRDRESGALYYEWLTEQGFALQLGAHVRPYVTQPYVLATMEDNFRELFPEVELPAYDGSVTQATRIWARERADNLLLIYGQFDPWSGGAMDAPERSTSARFFVPAATHGAQIAGLPNAEREAALAHATRMFGVPPVMPRMQLAGRAAAIRSELLAEKARRFDAQIVQHALRR